MDRAHTEPEQPGRLVLTRRAGESVAVGDYLIEVVSVKGAEVKLAFIAPKSVRVVRTELLTRKANKCPR